MIKDFACSISFSPTAELQQNFRWPLTEFKTFRKSYGNFVFFRQFDLKFIVLTAKIPKFINTQFVWFIIELKPQTHWFCPVRNNRRNKNVRRNFHLKYCFLNRAYLLSPIQRFVSTILSIFELNSPRILVGLPALQPR